MSITSEHDSNSESEEEDIDGLIASVLQDIEIKDAMNEGPEGSNVTHTKPTNTNNNSNSNSNSNSNNNNDNNNSDNNTNTNNSNHAPEINNRRKSESNTNHLLMKQQRYPVSSMDIQTVQLNKDNNIRSISSNHISLDLNNNTYVIKTCIKKIHTILAEVDEDKNGEIDYEEFAEGIRHINNNLLPNEIKEIYDEIVWNEFEELNIKLFIDLLKQRLKNIKNIHTIKKNLITPKKILNIAFVKPSNINLFIDKSPSVSPDPSSDQNNNNNNNNNNSKALNKIYEILKEKDDD
eukprot:277179_1